MYVSELQPGQRAFVETSAAHEVMVQRPEIGEYEAFTGRDPASSVGAIVLRNLETNRWMFLDAKTTCKMHRTPATS